MTDFPTIRGIDPLFISRGAEFCIGTLNHPERRRLTRRIYTRLGQIRKEEGGIFILNPKHAIPVALSEGYSILVENKNIARRSPRVQVAPLLISAPDRPMTEEEGRQWDEYIEQRNRAVLSGEPVQIPDWVRAPFTRRARRSLDWRVRGKPRIAEIFSNAILPEKEWRRRAISYGYLVRRDGIHKLYARTLAAYRCQRTGKCFAGADHIDVVNVGPDPEMRCRCQRPIEPGAREPIWSDPQYALVTVCVGCGRKLGIRSAQSNFPIERLKDRGYVIHAGAFMKGGRLLELYEKGGAYQGHLRNNVILDENKIALDSTANGDPILKETADTTNAIPLMKPWNKCPYCSGHCRNDDNVAAYGLYISRDSLRWIEGGVIIGINHGQRLYVEYPFGNSHSSNASCPRCCGSPGESPDPFEVLVINDFFPWILAQCSKCGLIFEVRPDLNERGRPSRRQLLEGLV